MDRITAVRAWCVDRALQLLVCGSGIVTASVEQVIEVADVLEAYIENGTPPNKQPKKK